MKKIMALGAATVLALSMSACGSDDPYQSLCDEQYNSAPMIGADPIAPAAFVAPAKGGGGGRGGGGGGFSGGSRGGSSGGGFKGNSGSSGSSKSWSWGSKPSGSTGNKRIDNFWKKNPSGAKPKVKSHGYHSNGGGFIVIMNEDGSQETIDCD